MPELVLQSNTPDGTGLRRLTFDRALPGHTTPGQFVTVHVEGHKPAYFALASSPGAPVELLVKVQGDAAETLADTPAGSVIEVSEPIGHGFPVDPDDTRPLLLLATGSGLSAVKPVIDAELARGLPREVTLLYGVYTPEHVSFPERLKAWRAAGVRAHVVVSEDVPDWDGLTGFVQQAAQALGFVKPGNVVVLCGYKAMVDEAKALWLAAGARGEDLLTNF
ncbi:MAG: hypothetical protein H6732_06085 [Alphaproteobacteria bacterium]|nr:hypothetical protein [Alphaproteobacteria bacterium]